MPPLYPLTAELRPRVSEFIRLRWGSEVVIAHGFSYRPAELEGFAAGQDDALSGLVTYQILDGRCEVVTIDSLIEGQGTGRRLMRAVQDAANAAGCREIWMITTNDNLVALRFYQRMGYRMRQIYPGAVDAARRLKPEIPLTGLYGIPIHDEIELALPLGAEVAS